MLSQDLLAELQLFITLHQSINEVESEEKFEYSLAEMMPLDELENFIDLHRQPSFREVLFEFIDQKELRDADIYKKAGIDRRVFSKIRTNPDYHPRKNTVLALALALELSKRDMDRLLSSIGYSLSDSETFDLVIQFCIEKEIYSLDDVNQALDYFSLDPLLGS